MAGLKPSTRRVLAELAQDGANESSLAAEPLASCGPATVLVREWRGISHQVTVLEDGIFLPRQALPFALGESRARSPALAGRGRCSSASSDRKRSATMEHAKLRSAAARSTPASLPKKGWSRTSTRCTHSARRAKRSSRARLARAGAWSRPPTTTAAFRAGRWNVRPCSACLADIKRTA